MPVTEPLKVGEAPDDAQPAVQDDAIPTVRDLLRERLDGHRDSAQALAREGKPPPVLELMGGPLGIVETVVPVAVFSTVYGVTSRLGPSLVAAIVPTAVVALWRLARRESLVTALSGLIAVGIGAFIASRTGRASDFFWPSVIKNLAYGVVYGASAAAGWPLIGVLLGFLLGEGTAWRRVPARRKAYLIATWLWAGMFALRVVVQTPLLLANKTVVLGAVNIFLGLPLFFLTVWGSWMVIRRVPVVHEEPDADGAAESGEVTGEATGKATGEATGPPHAPANNPDDRSPGVVQG